MNTQVSIEVPEAAETALSAAYEALLSMGRCPKWARPSIDPALLYAQASITRRYLRTNDYVCILTVQRLGEGRCRLTVTVDALLRERAYDHTGGQNILFMVRPAHRAEPEAAGGAAGEVREVKCIAPIIRNRRGAGAAGIRGRAGHRGLLRPAAGLRVLVPDHGRAVLHRAGSPGYRQHGRWAGEAGPRNRPLCHRQLLQPEQRATCRERHEYRADKWAVHALLPRQELERAVKEGCTEVWELAERFGLTEDFIRRAAYVYRCEEAE